MSDIVEVEEMYYFYVTVAVQFIFFDQMEKSKTFFIPVVIEKKETNCFNLDDVADAQNKAVLLFGETFKGTKMENYVEEANQILPRITAVSFLGISTHDNFIGNVKKTKEDMPNAD